MKKQELSGRLRMLVVQAGRFAREFGHSYVGTEHLLLAISEEAGGAGRCCARLGWRSRACGPWFWRVRASAAGPYFCRRGFHPERAARCIRRAWRPEGCTRQMSRRSICCSRFYGTTAVRRAGFYRKTARNSIACLRKPMERCMRGRSRSRGRQISVRLLEQYCENMIEKAAGMEPVIGRERELCEVEQILCRKNKITPP